MLTQKLNEKLKRNGLFFFCVLIFQRISVLCRGLIYRYLLGWKFSFELGGGAKIKGGKYIFVGDKCRFGDFFWMEAVEDYYGQVLTPKIFIGDGVVVNDFVHIAAANSVTIGAGCLIASKVLIIDHAHGVYFGNNQSSPGEPPALRRLGSKSVEIGENVWLGEYVSVLPGAKIGSGVIVGANSTVVGELPPNTICVGSPAKPVKAYSFETKTWNSI